jgi:hypothetical protein
VAGCDEPCCAFDGRPIPLERGPGGELIVRLATGAAEPGRALLDTGSPVTVWHTAQPASPPDVVRRDLRLLGPPRAGGTAPLRALIRQVLAINGRIGPIGTTESSFVPDAVLGGDLLRSFSVEIGFAVPEVTFWRRQPAADDFLAGAGYVLLHLPRYGGGELEALAPPDALGMRAPHQVPPSRLLLRACAAPAAFRQEEPLPGRCCPGDERKLATGADLSLVLTTGVGPLVLGRGAWERVRATLTDPPAATSRPLLLASSERPIMAEWTRLPRLALVNREADLGTDPGPCTELGRARRLEQVAVRQAAQSQLAACVLPCDVDPRTPGRAQNAAAYLEVGGELEVAIIDDADDLLQAVREEVRPDGPEVDGFLGAAALAGARVELDYLGKDTRALFSCEEGTPVERCRAVARCPRLPEPGTTHVCFGLPAHALPQMCENQAACGP